MLESNADASPLAIVATKNNVTLGLTIERLTFKSSAASARHESNGIVAGAGPKSAAALS